MNLATKPILVARNIGVEIEGVSLLKEVSLDIKSGEVLAIIGPNGSGKSTFLKTICGEQPLNCGHVELNGRPLDQWSDNERARQLAVLPQNSTLSFPFTAREVVSLARAPHHTGKRRDSEIVDEVLEYLDVAYLTNRLYPNLSGGEQQRVQLARVLAQIWPDSSDVSEPKLLLLDEPASSFDLAHQKLLMAATRQQSHRQTGVIVVLHDLNMAMACADRVAVFSCGRVTALGKVNDTLTESIIESTFSVKPHFIEDVKTGRRFLAPPDFCEN